MATPVEVLERSLARARHKLTTDEFHRMGEAGILDADDRVELLEGEIFDMAPIGSRHASIVDFLSERFTLVSQQRVLVRTQGPLQVPPHNEPLPDLLLLKPRPDRYRDALPRPADVLLVVEVSDSTLDRDRDVKIPLYGRQGISEAWLVNVHQKTVSIYRQPCPEGYRNLLELREGAAAAECLPDGAVPLAELFG